MTCKAGSARRGSAACIAPSALGHWFFLALLGLGGCVSLWALETDRAYGEASYQFLKLPLAPRITALGGAGIGLWDGGGETESNPASGAKDGSRLVLGYGLPFEQFGAKASHIAWNLPWGEYRMALGARYLGFDPLTGRDESGDATTDYGAHTLKMHVGLARAWRDLSLGLSVGFAQNNIAEATYSTGLISVGARYALGLGLSLGAAGTHADFAAGKFRESDARTPFPPTTVQAGLAWSQALPRGLEASAVLDARTRNDEQLAFPAGLEITWNKAVTVRAGYPFAAKEPGISAGLGLGWFIMRVNYALETHATLGAGHFMSLEFAY